MSGNDSARGQESGAQMPVPPASPAQGVREQIARNRVWIAILVLIAGGWLVWDSAQNSGGPGAFDSIIDVAGSPTVALVLHTTVANTEVAGETALRWSLNGTGNSVGPDSAATSTTNGALVWTLPYDGDTQQTAGMTGMGEPMDVVAELSDAATGIVLARVALTGAFEAPAAAECVAVTGVDIRCVASTVGVDDTQIAVTVFGSVYIPEVTGLD